MSLVLPACRPTPVRGLLLFVLVLTGLLASALGLAPTLVRTTGVTSHDAVCACAHCPGGAACCCRAKGSCPVPRAH